MAASQTVDDPTGGSWKQPQFDRRIRNFSLLQPDKNGNVTPIQRGYLKQANVSSGNATSQTTSPSGFLTNPRTVYFLYNPSSISVQHTISTSDAALDPNLRSALDTGQIGGPTGSTLSFSLMFDRTYEISDSTNFNTPLGETGVSVDVNALYALTGILELNSVLPTNLVSTPIAGSPADAANRQSKAEAVAVQAIQNDAAQFPDAANFFNNFVSQQDITNFIIAQPQNSQVLHDIIAALKQANLTIADLPAGNLFLKSIGGTSSTPTSSGGLPPGWPFVSSTIQNQQGFGYMTVKPIVAVFGVQRGNWNPCLQYYGYISSLGIEYAHWTQNMVPFRCAVSITMNLLATTVDKMTQAATYQGPS